MLITLATWIWEALKLALLLLGILYAVSVVVVYAHTGSDYHFKPEPEDWVRSLERLFLWLGVKVAGLAVALGKRAVDYFSEPSAEVGDWLISKSPRLQHVVARPPRS